MLTALVTVSLSLINLVNNEIYDYIYVISLIIFALIIIKCKYILKIDKFFSRQNKSTSLVLKYIKIFILVVVIGISLRYLLTFSKIIAILGLIFILQSKFRSESIKIVYVSSIVTFILEFAKTPQLLTDYFHPLYISDEIYSHINNKSIFVDYQSQYTALLGYPFNLLGKVGNIYQAIQISFLYLIVLQVVCLIILIYILKKTSGSQFKYSIILLFAVIAGTIWGDTYTISDFFQEMPARKIFPLLIIAVITKLIENREDNNGKSKEIYFYLLGIIIGISMINDFIFSTFNAIALFSIYYISRKRLNFEKRHAIITIINVLSVIMVFVLINKANIIFIKKEIFLGYILNYDQNNFGIQFAWIGPDVFFASIGFLGLIIFTSHLVKKNLEFRGEIFLLGYLSLLLIITSFYWAGRSFEVQIVASSGIYFTLIFSILLNYLSNEKNNVEFQKLLILFSLLSPIIFGLFNFNHFNNNLNRILKSRDYTYLNFESNKSQDIDNGIRTDIEIIENQINYIMNNEINSSKDITYVGRYGNLVSNKYNFYSGNVLNDPTSITNVKIMKDICDYSKQKNSIFIILDQYLQPLFERSFECTSNYVLINDVNNAFPRYNLYKSVR
jgi:hypothetical protein